MAGLGESEDGGGKMPPKKKKKESEEEEIEDSKPSSIAASSEMNIPPLSRGTSAASTTIVSGTPEQPMGGNRTENALEKYTSAAELEKLIRAIGTNPNLNTKQK